MPAIDEGKLLGRGISFPPRLGQDGRWAWSVGAENVREAIRIILLTQLKERLLLPEFGGGLKEFLFQPSTPATHRLIAERITVALHRWEPRIQLENVDVRPQEDTNRAVVAVIRYRLVATSRSEQLGLSIQFESS